VIITKPGQEIKLMHYISKKLFNIKIENKMRTNILVDKNSNLVDIYIVYGG